MDVAHSTDLQVRRAAPLPHAGPAALRRLRQEVENEEAVTVVAIASELRDAVAAGAQHVLITAHLDLRSQPAFLPDGNVDGTYRNSARAVLGSLKSSTTSMRGSCAEQPPPALLGALSRSAPLLPLQDGQCLLVIKTSLLFQDNDMWFDNLLVRFQRDPGAPTSYTGISTRQFNADSKLYMTRMAFQGDNQQLQSPSMGNTQAVGLNRRTSMYAEGCTFANLGGNGTEHGSPLAIMDASANFVRCRFEDNWIGGFGLRFHGLITAQWQASVRIENCTFFDNIGTVRVHLLDRSKEAAFYTDTPGLWVVRQNLSQERPKPLTAAPRVFLTAQDDFFLETQMEVDNAVLLEEASEDTAVPPGTARPPIPTGFRGAGPPAAPAVGPPAADGDTLGEASVVAFIAAAALVILFISLALSAACVFVYWFRKRSAAEREEWRQRAAEMQPTHAPAPYPHSKAATEPPASTGLSTDSITAALVAPRPATSGTPRKPPTYVPGHTQVHTPVRPVPMSPDGYAPTRAAGATAAAGNYTRNAGWAYPPRADSPRRSGSSNLGEVVCLSVEDEATSGTGGTSQNEAGRHTM